MDKANTKKHPRLHARTHTHCTLCCAGNHRAVDTHTGPTEPLVRPVLSTVQISLRFDPDPRYRVHGALSWWFSFIFIKSERSPAHIQRCPVCSLSLSERARVTERGRACECMTWALISVQRWSTCGTRIHTPSRSRWSAFWSEIFSSSPLMRDVVAM